MKSAEVDGELLSALVSAERKGRITAGDNRLRYEVTHGGKYATIRSGSGKDRQSHGNLKFDELPMWRQIQYEISTGKYDED